MTALWARIETLLGQVQKPARYIGCEDGAITPRYRAAGRCPGCWRTPMPTRSACPTRACRSSTRSSTNATTPSPSGPTRPGPTCRRCSRQHGLPLFSVDTHRAAGDFDVLAFNLSSELVFTNVLEMIDLAGVPVRAADRTPEHPLVVDRRPFGVQPRAARRLRRPRRARRGRGGRRRDHRGRAAHGSPPDARSREDVLRALAQVAGVYVPSIYDVVYDGPAIVSITPRFADVPGDGRQAHGRRSRRLAVPEAPARRRSPRSSTTA